MQKLGLLLLVLVLISVPAVAQKVEIFGGYQFTHLNPAYNASGWNASLTGNFKHVLGITADFSGAYKSNIDFHSYTVGPVLTARLPVVQPFGGWRFGRWLPQGTRISHCPGGLDQHSFSRFHEQQ